MALIEFDDNVPPWKLVILCMLISLVVIVVVGYIFRDKKFQSYDPRGEFVQIPFGK